MVDNQLICCNVCGKRWNADPVASKEEHVWIQKKWGYFSNKDGQTHTIRLCESCYDKWIQSFKVPVVVEEQIELL